MVNMELPSVVRWWGGRNRWRRRIHVFGCVVHQSIFFSSWARSSITNFQTSPIATSHLLSFSASIASLSLFLYHLILFLFSINSINFQAIFLTISFCSYVPPFVCITSPPSLLLLSIIYSNPVTCQCRSYSSELRGWLQRDKPYTITGRERGRSEEHRERGKWVRHR